MTYHSVIYLLFFLLCLSGFFLGFFYRLYKETQKDKNYWFSLWNEENKERLLLVNKCYLLQKALSQTSITFSKLRHLYETTLN